jgi:hypothetical protein
LILKSKNKEKHETKKGSSTAILLKVHLSPRCRTISSCDNVSNQTQRWFIFHIFSGCLPPYRFPFALLWIFHNIWQFYAFLMLLRLLFEDLFSIGFGLFIYQVICL